jgi:GDP-L-fucose synthase
VEQLVEDGAKVRVTYSRPQNFENLATVRKQVELLQADLYDPRLCEKAVKGQEIVLNLAARVAGIEFNKAHPAIMLRDNVALQQNVLEAARKENVDRFLTVSSACVYPVSSTIPTPEEEGFKDEPEPTNSGYGWAKRIGELLALKYQEEFGMKIAIARPYNSYGPRDDFDPKTSHVIPALIRRVEMGENPLSVWGDGSPTRAFCYVTDFANGLALCAERGIGKGAINIGTDDEVSIRELVERIVKISGKNPKIVFDKSRPNGQPRRNSDNTKAIREIGFKAKVGLNEGLKNTIEWYRKSGPKN